MIPVIMSGGSGTRLWPLSRQNRPKQFLKLFGEFSMLQSTLKRLEGFAGLEAPIVVANSNHRFMVAEQLQQLNITDPVIILEPCPRNTAPAIALAAQQAVKQGEDPILLVLAADHIINDVNAFHQAIRLAEPVAMEGKLVTFGIVPECAHSGYGYIQAVEKNSISPVKAFVEKPDVATAEEYLSSGDYYWNSGMFMFKASVYLSALEKFAAEIATHTAAAINNAVIDLDYIRADQAHFAACPADSIDYAVMEKTNDAVVVSLNAGWSDVGSWSSLAAAHKKDDNQNTLVGDVLVDGVKDSYIHSESRLVSVLGLDNVVVVETADAVLVTNKAAAENIKNTVEQLKAQGREESTMHRLCYRPWGHYDSIDAGARYKVKRITVKPGASLSLQMHHHRAEHWVVVKGTAEVTCEDKITILTENQSTFIPLGSTHRLKNPGCMPLELIEVQSGSYLGEDDITRFQDDYNRH